jgi:hypothetical protein
VVALVTMLSLAFSLVLTAWYADPARLFTAYADEQGSFYAVLSARRDGWRVRRRVHFRDARVRDRRRAVLVDGGERLGESVRSGAIGAAARDAATLKYLDGGGDGCTYPGRRHPSRDADSTT